MASNIDVDLSFGVDLLEASKHELSLLRLVRDNELLHDPGTAKKNKPGTCFGEMAKRILEWGIRFLNPVSAKGQAFDS